MGAPRRGTTPAPATYIELGHDPVRATIPPVGCIGLGVAPASGLSARVLATLQAAWRFGLITQGIGLRPQKPWARVSRPVGPVLLEALRGPGPSARKAYALHYGSCRRLSYPKTRSGFIIRRCRPVSVVPRRISPPAVSPGPRRQMRRRLFWTA